MFDVKIINSVLKALSSTFKAVAQTNLILDKPKLQNKIEGEYGIVTTIGFNGVLEGNLIYTLNQDIALIIANKMMGGVLELTELDEMAVSAIGELGNMTSGSIAMNLETIGYNIDITPPSIVEGKALKVSVEGNILKFPSSLPEGDKFDVYLILKK